MAAGKKAFTLSLEEKLGHKCDNSFDKKLDSTNKSDIITIETLEDEQVMSSIMISRTRRYVARCLPPLLRPRRLDGYTLTRRGRAHRMDVAPNQDASFILLPGSGVRHYAVVGVLDGHGTNGHTVARMASEWLERALTSLLPTGLKASRPREHAQNTSQVPVTDVVEAAFKETATGVSASSSGADSGSTATAVVVQAAQVTIAWAGDSRAVVINGRGAIRLTTEMHRGTNLAEAARVREAGGQIKDGYVVDKDGKVGVAVTRAMGDMDISHIGICSKPEISTLPFESVKGGAVIVASDGLWDASGVSPDLVANTVARRHKNRYSARRVCEDLLQLACGQNEAPQDDCTIACLLFP